MKDEKKIDVMPNDYLVWSILVTLFCCLPFGIIGIVYSAKVSSLWNSGQVEAAEKASRSAKNWCIFGALIGAAMAVVYAFVEFVTIMNS